MMGRGAVHLVWGMLFAILIGPIESIAQELGGSATMDISYARIALVFFAVLGGISIAYAAIRNQRSCSGAATTPFWANLISKTGGGEIRIVEFRRLGPGTELCIFECMNTRFLILVTAGSAKLLKEQQIETSDLGN